MYHAQPRHSLQRISCSDDGQLRAPVLEPAGSFVQLDKRPGLTVPGTMRPPPELAAARSSQFAGADAPAASLDCCLEEWQVPSGRDGMRCLDPPRKRRDGRPR